MFASVSRGAPVGYSNHSFTSQTLLAMRKFLFLFALLLTMTGLQACTSDDPAPTLPPDQPSQPDQGGDNGNGGDNGDGDNATTDSTASRTLVVYYSFTNNVHTIVTDLLTQIDADVVRVEPAEEGIDYAANNYAAGSALIAAIRANPDDPASYPNIKTTVDNLDDYDRIIIGTPLWWSDMAAPMQSFLFKYGKELAGKQIGLIVSSSSSGISGVEGDAHRLVPEGRFMSKSLWIRSSQTSNCHSLIAQWLEDTGQQ